jgi:ferric-dicitrate binding protein FerR (iron transport regulator)
MKEYLSYTPEDFICDETFLAWFYKSNPEFVAFWDEWIEKHPQKKPHIEQALQMLHLLNMQEKEPSDQAVKIAQSRMLASISDSEKSQEVLRVSIYRRKQFMRIGIAASIALLLAFSILFWWINQTVTYTTAYGEKRSVILPDESIVTLNGNSSIWYESTWKEDKDREVHLIGEAFFSVRHKPSHTRFLVHTSQLQVEVLGTKFNVSDRKDKTQVVLLEGKVELTHLKRNNKEKLLMKPGELVVVSPGERVMAQKIVKPEVYASWKDNELTFDETPLGEIASLLEENYGYQVTFSDAALAQKKFNGVFPADDLSLLFEAISTSFGIKIIQDKNSLRFSSKP